ncbi:MAG: hypothetical protein ACI8UR_000922 [Natronomonas sp.]|uniref:hypothetical protein n=1 Tax=Natronomonas sp. TaxID=2184060 RepID=UPI0039E4DE66
MGDDANRVAAELKALLEERWPNRSWTTEEHIGRTPVDVAGTGDPRVLIELEWRRADPSNNTVKLFRHIAEDSIDQSLLVIQLFTRYYDLKSGGVSSKRENAVFVGDRVAETFDSVEYEALTLDIEPPKRGGPLPGEWEKATERVVEEIDASL